LPLFRRARDHFRRAFIPDACRIDHHLDWKMLMQLHDLGVRLLLSEQPLVQTMKPGRPWMNGHDNPPNQITGEP
jgi:hypothetical protein